jgi:hypothetical protein
VLRMPQFRPGDLSKLPEVCKDDNISMNHLSKERMNLSK